MSRPKFILKHSTDYREFFSTGVMGGMNPNKCSILFFNDKPKVEMNEKEPGKMTITEVEREIVTEIVVTPMQFKQIAMWMTNNVAGYESRFGKIEIKPEDDKRPMNFIS